MFKRVLVANRGEIAWRIVRALQELSIPSLAIYASDDINSPHVRWADQSVPLKQAGPPAYLDIEGIIAIAREHACDAIHPGYGFLSERAEFATACTKAGLCFIGPEPAHIALLGDKVRTREYAKSCGIPIIEGSHETVSLSSAEKFLSQHPEGILLKAASGGGGRGMRVVHTLAELSRAYALCCSEAKSAFGLGEVYVERYLQRCRHIEIQVLGDGKDLRVLPERECSVQRSFQKILEISPSPSLSPDLRRQLQASARAMAEGLAYKNIGTFEFLVPNEAVAGASPFFFIEANPRLQVEHTITEEITGIDLVKAQILLATGCSLDSLDLPDDQSFSSCGYAMQWRINAETLSSDGQTRPSSGLVSSVTWATGPGVRIDTYVTPGTSFSPFYDTLLAKLIVYNRSGSFADTLRRSQRALAEIQIEGLATNIDILRALVGRDEIRTQAIHTQWFEKELPSLLETAKTYPQHSHQHLQSTARAPAVPLGEYSPPSPGTIVSPMSARLIEYCVAVGDTVSIGHDLAVIEAMKMQHVLKSTAPAEVAVLLAKPGDFLHEGQAVLTLTLLSGEGAEIAHQAQQHDPDYIRPDLQKLFDRMKYTEDSARPSAIQKRHAGGGRSARENVADLCDEGSFIEYGAFAVAAQSNRRSEEDLMRNTPADGMITGIGTINANYCDPDTAQCVVMAYDATVLAGTQGARNHAKTDRMLGIADEHNLPVVLFAEGGGGRPGDTDFPIIAGLNVPTFRSYAKLSGQVPLIGVVNGKCFAGNAALLGCSDVIIATQDSNIGMGGPAMIEGGGLGVFPPHAIGDSHVQHGNGVIDILVANEAEAVAAAKHYLSFFQGKNWKAEWRAPDPSLLRDVVPEDRRRAFDTREAMYGIVDTGSLLMLRTGFGIGIHTALARIEGIPLGIVANNPLHLGGAIDADAADKMARFMQLCNTYHLPMVSLVDTPGFMVGPAIEKLGQVRHVSRLFVTAAKLNIPYLSVVLRKGYGLGAMAMTAGSFHAPLFTIAWQTGEFGAMGLEGAVRLGFRKELAALPEGIERDALFNQLLGEYYAKGAAINMAKTLEIDAVIDPAKTRDWIKRCLRMSPPAGDKKRFIDTW